MSGCIHMRWVQKRYRAYLTVGLAWLENGLRDERDRKSVV